MGGIQWSPKLQTFRDKIELWHMVVRRRKHRKISTKRIRRFMKKTGIRDALQCGIDQATHNLNLSFKEYREAKKHTEVWRDEHLISLAKANADKKGTEEAAKEKQLQ